MSPQMNGEPREAASSSASDAMVPPSALNEAARSLPQVINTDRVSKTAAKEERQLAPLFTEDSATAFRTRWDLVQKGFVDDPKAAVHAADELVAHVTKSLTDTFANQRADLEQRFNDAQEPTTENLRIALRQYRSFFERLLSI
jgi:hypothetical protein